MIASAIVGADDRTANPGEAAPSALRVLLLAQWYEPVIGGEEVQVRTLAHSLASRGHAVTVAALAHPERPPEYWDGPVHVYRVRAALQRLPMLFTDASRQSAPPFPDPGIASALNRIVRRERPHVVHAHNWIVHSYVPVRRERTPLILTLHDHSLSCAKKLFLYRGATCSGPAPAKCFGCATDHYGLIKGAVTLGGLWASRVAVMRAVDCFIGVSGSVLESSFAPDHDARRVAIPNFLPEGFADTAARPPDGLPDAPFILFVGSLARVKGIEVLLRAFERLEAATRPPLVLLGYTGSELISSLGEWPGDATVLTDQPREAVAAAWRRSLLGVVPSIGPETFGLVALEGMAMGRPVVASRVGGLQEVVQDGETGLLVPAGDSAALASAMARLLHDRALRERMGSAAAIRARAYSADAVVPRIEALYRELITARRARARASRPIPQEAGTEMLTRR
jgi:glycosyltransferase involved in cell wall biosynthesis